MERDSMKMIYARMMFAAEPMFVKLSPQEQFELVQHVANTLIGKIQRKEACINDSHILVLDTEHVETIDAK